MGKRRGGYRAPKNYVPQRTSRSRPGRDESADTPEREPRSGGERRAEPRGGRQHRDTHSGRQRQGRETRRVESRRDESRGRDRGTDRRGTRAPSGWTPDDRVLERLEARAITAAEAEGVTFAQLGLDERLIRALDGLGAHDPFPIQVATVPDILGGRNVLGRGRTGSGKTIAFGAGLVQRLIAVGGRARGEGRPPRAIVVAPTRELALQIDRTIQPLARAVGMFTAQLYGGVPYAKQQTALGRGVDIVIGTPGRIEDLVRRGRLDLSHVAITVLDEADEMADMGFLEPIERILSATRENGQRLLFSATLDSAVLHLVERFLPDPAVHEVAGEAAEGDIDHRVLVVERGEKDAVLARLAGSGGRVLVFARTRAGAERYASALAESGVPSVALHGDLSQAVRTRHLAQFDHGNVDVLVATDVAARGIHIDDVRLVIHADPAEEYKTYLHRSGRTGRAGNRGTVITLIAPTRRAKMQALLDRAEIEAPMMPASAGGAELDEFEA